MTEIFWTDFRFEHNALPLIVRTVGGHNESSFILPNGFPEYQILLTLSGSGEFVTKDNVYPLPTGTLCFTPPHESLHYQKTSVAPWEVLWITFTTKTPLSNITSVKTGFYKTTGNGIQDAIFNIIELARTVPRKNRRCEASILLYQLLLRLPLFLLPYDIPSKAQQLSGIPLARHYIHTHYTETVTVTRLAEIAGMERTDFTRKFQKAYGALPSDYIERHRLRIIIEFIKRAGDMSISEIAAIFGFPDPSQLYRLLKKYSLSLELRTILQNLASRGDWV